MFFLAEGHLHEDNQCLMEAVAMGDRGRFEHSVHLMQGRCGHVAHVIKAEMRENPARYSSECRQRIRSKVQEMETRCEQYIKLLAVVFVVVAVAVAVAVVVTATAVVVVSTVVAVVVAAAAVVVVAVVAVVVATSLPTVQL